jgi:periplasmic divalent cation tolerance protein
MSNYKLFYITCKNSVEAKKIANHLIKTKLIACANIIPSVHSIFLWKGKTSKSKESVIIGKTKKKLISKIIQSVKNIHSYDVPCIVFMNITDGNKPFLNWINSSTNRS